MRHRIAVEVLCDDSPPSPTLPFSPRGRRLTRLEPLPPERGTISGWESDADSRARNDPIDVDALAGIERDLGHLALWLRNWSKRYPTPARFRW